MAVSANSVTRSGLTAAVVIHLNARASPCSEPSLGLKKVDRGVVTIARAHLGVMEIASVQAITAKHAIARLRSHVQSLFSISFRYGRIARNCNHRTTRHANISVYAWQFRSPATRRRHVPCSHMLSSDARAQSYVTFEVGSQ